MVKTIAAETSDFAAVLDEVIATRAELVITRDGAPVARLVPFGRLSLEELRGSVRFLGDIVEPIDTDEWTFDEDKFK